MVAVGGTILMRALLGIIVLDESSTATGRGNVIDRSLEKPVTVITLEGKC